MQWIFYIVCVTFLCVNNAKSKMGSIKSNVIMASTASCVLQMLLVFAVASVKTDESVEVVDPSESPTFYFPVNKLNLLVPATLPRGSILFRTKALPLSDNSSGKTPTYHSLLKVPSWLQIDSDELDLVVKLRRNATPSVGTVVVKIEAENTTVDELPHDDSLNEVPLNVLVMELTVLNENSTRVLCAADNSTENLCFWPFVSWRVLEEEPDVSLSSPGPEYLQRFCNRTFQYRLAANDSQGSGLAVTKDKNGVWQLQTVRPLDRELATNDTVDAVVARAQLLCSEMGTDVIPKMKPRTVSSRNISVELIDRDDNPPEGQNKEPVYLETNVLVQGAEYAKNALLLQDSDSDLRQRYQISIVEDPSELWLVRCGPTTELKFKWPFPHAIISCYLTPRENRTLAENSKHNITLLVQDITMEHIRPHVDNNVLLPLSLVAGPRPRDPTALAAASAPAASAAAAAASSDAAWRPRYPRAVALARWVAPLARVARPRTRPRANAVPAPAPAPASSFRVEAAAAPGAFAVTRRQGIVYVKDPDVLARAPDSLIVRVWWSGGDEAETSFEVSVRLVTQASSRCATAPPTERQFHCADFATAHDCIRHCAQGVGAARPRKGDAVAKAADVDSTCTWRSIGPSQPQAHANFTTCTPDVLTCPDGECDELERENKFLCPQDCVWKDDNDMHMAYNAHGQGIAMAPGICSCSLPHKCVCLHEPPTPPAPPAPPSSPPSAARGALPSLRPPASAAAAAAAGAAPDAVPLGRSAQCGVACRLALVFGSTLLIVGTAGLVFWRYRVAGKGRCARKLAVSSAAALEAAARRRTSSSGAAPAASADSQRLAPVPDAAFVAPDPRWEFPRKQLTLEQPLGEGEFGRVLRARALNIAGHSGYTTVAVKTLKEGACAGELADLLSEFALLQQVRHPNVVRLLGACSAGCAAGEPFLLIIEFAEHGSLRSYLRRSRHAESDGALPCSEPDALALAHAAAPRPRAAPPRRAPPPATPRDVLGFAWQIAKGMAYLSDIKLIHRDLAARNVLVAEGGICKISDFGLTRDVYEDDTYMKRSKGRVPVKWMSLESLADHMYTSKSDVWSFGVLLWELVTLGASPYPGVAVHNLFHLLKTGYRMQRPENCSPALYRLMRLCWHENPDERPTFKELMAIFEKMLEDGVDYLDLNPRTVHNMTYFASLSRSRDILDDPDGLYGNFNILPNNSVNNLAAIRTSQNESNVCITLSDSLGEEEERLLHSSNETTPVDTIDFQKSLIGVNLEKRESPRPGNAYLSPIRQINTQQQDSAVAGPSSVALTQRYISISTGESRSWHHSRDSSPVSSKVTTF